MQPAQQAQQAQQEPLALPEPLALREAPERPGLPAERALRAAQAEAACKLVVHSKIPSGMEGVILKNHPFFFLSLLFFM